MRIRRSLLLGVILLLLVVGLTLQPAQAAQGQPLTSTFAYGARLDIRGQQVDPALNAAARIGIGWVAVDFDWQQLWAEYSVQPDLTPLSQALALANQDQINVMLAIQHAPAWAMTADGPNADLTAELIVALSRHYPDTITAVELYPGANTVAGWGTSPNPQVYADLVRTVQRRLETEGLNMILISGGLMTLSPTPAPGDMDDRQFLQQLYQADAAAVMPIIGLRLPEIVGEPLAAPSETDQRYLRHFEAIRQVMLDNDHQSGRIWITGFSWPASGPGAPSVSDEQVQWFTQAYRLLHSQLYIGAAFFTQLNPSVETSHLSSLVLSDGSLHPALNLLGRYAEREQGGSSADYQGNISKKTPLKLGIKP